METKEIEKLIPSEYQSEILHIEMVPLSQSYKLAAADGARIYNVSIRIKPSAYLPAGASASLCKAFDDKLYFAGVDDPVCPVGSERAKDNMKKVLDAVAPGGPFGCCAHYLECSDKHACVHENPFYSHGCIYKSNLDKGAVFYGENRNM